MSLMHLWPRRKTQQLQFTMSVKEYLQLLKKVKTTQNVNGMPVLKTWIFPKLTLSYKYASIIMTVRSFFHYSYHSASIVTVKKFNNDFTKYIAAKFGNLPVNFEKVYKNKLK